MSTTGCSDAADGDRTLRGALRADGGPRFDGVETPAAAPDAALFAALPLKNLAMGATARGRLRAPRTTDAATRTRGRAQHC